MMYASWEYLTDLLIAEVSVTMLLISIRTVSLRVSAIDLKITANGIVYNNFRQFGSVNFDIPIIIFKVFSIFSTWLLSKCQFHLFYLYGFRISLSTRFRIKVAALLINIFEFYSTFQLWCIYNNNSYPLKTTWFFFVF